MTDKKPAKKSKVFTDEERAAMKERILEEKAAAKKADGESAVLAAIAKMPEPDRALGKRLHAIIKASAPALSPRTWYGMPAYAKDDNVVCFFQAANKFKTRYATLGFSDEANLDEGRMWPVAFALTELTAAEEERIGALIKKSGELNIRTGAISSPKDKSASQQIDAIIKKSDDWRGKRLSQLRILIRKTDTDIIEEVKWKKPSNPMGVPVWSHDGIVCIGDTLKNAVRLTFPKGAQMKDPKKLFNTRLDSNTVRAIDFHEGDAVNETGLKALILEAVKQNTSKGER